MKEETGLTRSNLSLYFKFYGVPIFFIGLSFSNNMLEGFKSLWFIVGWGWLIFFFIRHFFFRLGKYGFQVISQYFSIHFLIYSSCLAFVYLCFSAAAKSFYPFGWWVAFTLLTYIAYQYIVPPRQYATNQKTIDFWAKWWWFPPPVFGVLWAIFWNRAANDPEAGNNFTLGEQIQNFIGAFFGGLILFGGTFLTWFFILVYPKRTRTAKPVKIDHNRPIQEHYQWLQQVRVFPTYERKCVVVHDTHGSARFLSDNEKNDFLNDKNQVFPAGLYLGGGAWHAKQSNLLTIAPPRSGKGASIIIPNLLLRDRLSRHKMSFVVFDPKGTNARIAGGHLKNIGFDVVCFDPYNIQKELKNEHPLTYGSFNPLALVDVIDSNKVAACKRIAGLFAPDNPNDPNIWSGEARAFIFAVMLHVVTDPQYEGKRNLVTVYQEISKSDWENLFATMEDNTAENGAVSAAAQRWRSLMNTAKETFGGVIFNVNACIAWLAEPNLQDLMQENTYNPFDLEHGGKAIFLCLPFDKTGELKVFSRLFFGLSLIANGRPAATPKKWVYYLLDEFPSMGVFPEVIKGMAAYPEYNMRFWLFSQDLTMLDRIYTKAGRSEIVSLCDVFQAFKLNDLDTAKYVSERLGETTIDYTTPIYNETKTGGKSEGQSLGRDISTSSGENEGWSSGYTYQNTRMPRRLLTAEEVMKDDHIICFVKDVGNFRLKRSMYYKYITANPPKKSYFDYAPEEQKPICEAESEYAAHMQKVADANPNY